MKDKIDVLDHGYVRLVGVFGTDLNVVDAARVSFNKESAWEVYCVTHNEKEVCSHYSEGSDCVGGVRLKSADKRLIAYLAKHGHSSPFRHAFLSFEVKAPLLVARQWWKYVVGSDHTMDGWNEVSRRYVQDDMEFYIPDVDKWRSAPENKKQGSGECLPVTVDTLGLTGLLHATIRNDIQRYQQALELGVAIEQARLFLPAYAMYTMWRWSASLQSVGHFLNQRLGDDAQWEIQQYAQAVYDLSKPHFPASIEALCDTSDSKG